MLTYVLYLSSSPIFHNINGIVNKTLGNMDPVRLSTVLLTPTKIKEFLITIMTAGLVNALIIGLEPLIIESIVFNIYKHMILSRF